MAFVHDAAMGDVNRQADPLIARLPTVYAVALRLEAAGAGNEAIADALGVDATAVPALLDVGRRKLDEVRRTGHDTGS